MNSINELLKIYTTPTQVLKKSDIPRITIVGAGIAGLNAAYVLRQSGIHAALYEASQRIGGRIYAVTNKLAARLVTELGPVNTI